MTSWPRTRKRLVASVGKGYGLSAGPNSGTTSPPPISSAVEVTPAVFYEDVCQDYVSDSLPYPDHPLTSDQFSGLSPALANCNWLARSTLWNPPRYSRRYASAVRLLPISNYDVSPTLSPNWTDLKNQALQRYNPNQPVVDVPVALLELVFGFPQMLKDIGDKLRGRIGPGDYVAWQFGWGPLLQDLRSLLRFQQTVDKRLEELKSLSHRPSGQKIGFKSIEGSVSVGPLARGPVRFSGVRHTVIEQWAVYTHLVDVGRLPTFPDRDVAADLAFKTNIDAATLWELIPWSWLFDWFLGVGNFLALSNNRIPYLVYGLNIMAQSTTTETLTSISYNDPPTGATIEKEDNFASLVGRSVKCIRKQRMVYHDPKPGVAIHLPFLTSGQLGILGSIYTGKYKFRI